MKCYINIRRYEAGCKRRDSNPQVHIISILHLFGDPFRNEFFGIHNAYFAPPLRDYKMFDFSKTSAFASSSPQRILPNAKYLRIGWGNSLPRLQAGGWVFAGTVAIHGRKGEHENSEKVYKIRYFI